MNIDRISVKDSEQNFVNSDKIADGSPLALTTYLTTQLQEIICMGPGHVLTWANNRKHQSLPNMARRAQSFDWMQVSVHSGTECYLMIQFVLPELYSDALRSHLDHLFSQYGWTNAQGDGRECLVYHVAQSESARRLMEAAEGVAGRCAEVMKRLWQAHLPADIALLGLRGPRLAPQTHAVQPKPDIHLLLQPLSRVA